MEGVVTLQEVETHWSLDDVLRALAYQDMRQDLTLEAHRRAKNDVAKQTANNRTKF